MAIHREIQIQKSAAEVYQRLKETLSFEEIPADLQSAVVWDDARQTASFNKLGAQGHLCVSGENPCTLTMDASIAFPASLMIAETEFETQIDKLLARLMGGIK